MRAETGRVTSSGEVDARPTVRVAKFHTPEIIIGPGSLDEIPRAAAGLGMRRLMIVADRELVATPWYPQLAQRLRAADLRVSSYTGVSPNPRAPEIAAGFEHYEQTRAEGIVALGGGSVIDAAKGIAILAANGGHILSYEGIDRARRPLPPMVAAPTTAGSGSDVSQFCIVNDVDRMTKVTIIGRGLVPDVSVIDPLALATLPHDVAAQSGMDAITHCIEAYASVAHTRLTDRAARSAIGTAWHSIERFVDDPADADAGMEMAYAALEAGMAFTNAILGATHAMSHPVGGLCDAPHGAINSVLLPHVIRFNAEVDPTPYVDLADAIGLGTSSSAHVTAERFADQVAGLSARVGMPSRLRDFGVRDADIPALTVNALADACMRTNPRQPTTADVARMYREAL
ncbi:iron-containing alcohol dehydrogenase [Gordonia sp. NB41Y]|uniref:iron-containing alcohol dehydrogenase n=1 Tax=Gordonia sp. NB41Y TaxID=875808 RepID=UPI0002BE4264|nr:iron-containing alcohol dehydrogenase [Gordonia sp. NB41Y]EMP12230.1 alcohol dehydrogenase [Gordonia sp. NB41Y]WLP91401.1 iron-containing alcohol dehydrogenase [Gordonia sp. NB41Y]